MAIATVVLKKHFEEVSTSYQHSRLGKIWVPARPLNWERGYYLFTQRLKDACGVLMGRYNAIYWEDK